MTGASHTLRPIEALDYYDSRSITLPVSVSPLQAWTLIMAEPQPILRVAFWIRDAISSRFGVKRIGGFSGTTRDEVKVGDHLDFFLVEGVEPDLLVLTARDRHLDVMTSISTADRSVTVTSSVVTHNLFGRAYMLPVGVAHKWIVQGMLRRLQRRLEGSCPLRQREAMKKAPDRSGAFFDLVHLSGRAACPSLRAWAAARTCVRAGAKAGSIPACRRIRSSSCSGSRGGLRTGCRTRCR